MLHTFRGHVGRDPNDINVSLSHDSIKENGKRCQPDRVMANLYREICAAEARGSGRAASCREGLGTGVTEVADG